MSTPLETLCTLLQDEGYRAKPLSEQHVRTGMGGYIVTITVHEGSVNFSCPVQLSAAEEIRTSTLNSFNRDYRFGKVYLTDEIELQLDADFFLEIDQPDARDRVRYILILFENLIDAARRTFDLPPAEAASKAS